MKTEMDLSPPSDIQCTRPILVVDDMELLREAFALALTLEGYQVETAENGLGALNTLSSASCSLILLDLGMPIMNGYEFLSAYGRQPKPHTPVIILNWESDSIEEQVLPDFVVNVLPKPFYVTELLELVQQYI